MKNFKFAVIGAGGISAKFCDAVNRIDGCCVAAIASRSEEKAQKFALANGIEEFYGDYDEMLSKVNPDCVYIGTITSTHYDLTKKCINAHTPVLCEKAMFTNSKEALEIFELAKRENIFVMEAMWSRFLPTIKKAKAWLDEGKIGKMSFAEFVLGFIADKNPEHRYFSREQGGGASFDITVYAYELMDMMIEEEPSEMDISVLWSESGVDAAEQITVKYTDKIVSLSASLISNLDERMALYGDGGKIIVPRPHFGNEAFLYDKDNKLVEHFIDNDSPNGFVYEAQEAMQCVKEGKIESEVVPHSLTISSARLYDEIWKTGR